MQSAGAIQSFLTVRIEQDRPELICATVFTRGIQQMGYTGQVGQVKRFKRFIRHLKVNAPVEPLIRCETAAGIQMPADFIVFRRGANPLLAFVATLGISRASFVWFTTDERAETVREGLVRDFEFFGSVPRQVLFDNAKSVVIDRDAYCEGKHRFHPGLPDLTKRHRFVHRLCRPYRAKNKGEVERINRFVRHQFYLPLMT